MTNKLQHNNEAETNRDGPTQHDDEAPRFQMLLTPHRSLSANGFWWLMAFVGFSCFISGLLFAVMGAWPIMFFLAADVLVIWIAFKANYRSGRIFEEISIWPHELTVRKVSPRGRVQKFSFNPFWTRFDVKRHEEIGVTSMRLHQSGQEIELGKFLNPADRESFATAFGQALASVRR